MPSAQQEQQGPAVPAAAAVLTVATDKQAKLVLLSCTIKETHGIF